jgi:His/Glu/Gln/Arg/opine family amino acid ABC transporter permease subunit
MFDTNLARESFVPLMHGLVRTLEYTVVVIVLSLVLAMPIALARLSKRRLIRVAVGFYIEVFRTTPLLIQLIYIYFALPQIGIRLSIFTAGVLGMTLHYVAFISEVYRSGIQAIPRGQFDAARALGLKNRAVMLRVVLPQALRIVTPALGNFLISLIKDTSLLSAITVPELLFSGQIISGRTYDYFTIYTMVFAIYLVVGYAAVLLVRWVERSIGRRHGLVKRRPENRRHLADRTLAAAELGGPA